MGVLYLSKGRVIATYIYFYITFTECRAFSRMSKGGQIMLKVAVIILVVMLVYATVYSLMDLIMPKVVMASVLMAASGKTVDDAQTDGYLKPLAISQRIIGVFALAATISGFFILFAGFRKAQKWAWWALLVVGGVAWFGGLIISIAIRDNTNMIFLIIGVVLCIAGVFLPIKSFFGQATGEI
jgi:hypothetical protein